MFIAISSIPHSVLGPWLVFVVAVAEYYATECLLCDYIVSALHSTCDLIGFGPPPPTPIHDWNWNVQRGGKLPPGCSQVRESSRTLGILKPESGLEFRVWSVSRILQINKAWDFTFYYYNNLLMCHFLN